MSQKYELGAWDLKDLYPGLKTKEMDDAFAEMTQLVEELEGYRAKLSDDVAWETVKTYLDVSEKLNRLVYRIYQYASLRFSEDSQNQEVSAFQGKVMQAVAQMENRLLFFGLWWKALDDANADRLLALSGEYAYYLRKIRSFKPYTLSEKEEQVINTKNVTGVNALQQIYSMITSKYEFPLMVDGEEKLLTRGELMTYVTGSDEELRKAAYDSLYDVFSADGTVLGEIYQNIVRDWKNENLEMRGFDTALSARNLSNDIPDEVVNVLLEAAQENVDVFQRFFALKAKLLGVEKLRRYDLYAPMTKADKKYDFDFAVNLTLDAYADFDAEVAGLAKRIFEKDHLHSAIQKGKDTGAFCSYGDPALTPYVLVNFNGNARDVSTLAHELGHAIHGMLAEEHNVFNYSSTLPLAETASTFGEMLLTDRFLAVEKDEDVRRDLLFTQVDDAYATIQRQAFFALFEKQAHAMIADGASTQELCEAYLENLKTQFGDTMDVSENFQWEWVCIPHIYHVPFYVYAYAFGQLLVFALYQAYKEEGESFIPKYKALLSAGGSKEPVVLLEEAGFDVTKKSFWQGGFDFIAGMVDELERL